MKSSWNAIIQHSAVSACQILMCLNIIAKVLPDLISPKKEKLVSPKKEKHSREDKHAFVKEEKLVSPKKEKHVSSREEKHVFGREEKYASPATDKSRHRTQSNSSTGTVVVTFTRVHNAHCRVHHGAGVYILPNSGGKNSAETKTGK